MGGYGIYLTRVVYFKIVKRYDMYFEKFKLTEERKIDMIINHHELGTSFSHNSYF